jgi:chromosome segregation ATPase
MTNKAQLEASLKEAVIGLREAQREIDLHNDQYTKLRDDYNELLEKKRRGDRENDELSQTIAIYEERLKDLHNTRTQLGMVQVDANQAEHDLSEAESAVLVLSRLLTEERVR